LLIKEAQRMNVRVNVDDLKMVMQNDIPQLDDDRKMNDYQQAVYDMLLVRDAFVRAIGVIKISQPLERYRVATNAQSITVDVADFDAAKYAAKVTPPTTQQLQLQFARYQNTPRGQPNPTTNPFGFGYQYPDRLKLQYIEVSNQ